MAKRFFEATPGSAAAQLFRAGKNKTVPRSFAEASVDRGKREAQVIIITEGPGNEVDKHYYSAEAIKDAVTKFEGAKAFFNHQTEDEENARPEQNILEACGFYKGLKLVQVKDRIQGKMVPAVGATFVAEAGAAGDRALGIIETQMLYSQVYPDSSDCYAGISINSGGWSDEEDGEIEINGEAWTKVMGFANVRSADFVTRPARGGAFLALAESMAPVGTINPKESTVKNLKQIKVLVGKLAESEKKLKAATDATKKAALVKESQTIRIKLQGLAEAETGESKGLTALLKFLEAEDSEAGKLEADMEAAEEGEDGSDGDDDAMDNLKKHMPMKDGEDEEAYKTRVKTAMGHAGKAGLAEEGEEAEEEETEEEEAEEGGFAPPKKESVKFRESAALKTFRKESPKLFAELTTNVRESLGAERKDFKALRESVNTLTVENKRLKLERNLGVIEKQLAEAGIPREFLAPGDLIRMSESQRKRQITQVLAIMEGAGASQVWGGMREGEGRNDGGSDLAKFSIPTVKAGEEN